MKPLAWLLSLGAVLGISKIARGARPPSSLTPHPSSRSLDERWFPYITPAERDRLFGPLVAEPAPTRQDPEAVIIRNDFVRKIKTKVYPQLSGVPGVSTGAVPLHEAAIPSFEAILDELEARGLLHLIESFSGSFVPRFIRGSDTTLSSHAYGTSIDINANENRQGYPPTDDQRRIAEVFAQHGWFWGDWFKPTRDPMHFEFIGRSHA